VLKDNYSKWKSSVMKSKKQTMIDLLERLQNQISKRVFKGVILRITFLDEINTLSLHMMNMDTVREKIRSMGEVEQAELKLKSESPSCFWNALYSKPCLKDGIITLNLSKTLSSIPSDALESGFVIGNYVGMESVFPRVAVSQKSAPLDCSGDISRFKKALSPFSVRQTQTVDPVIYLPWLVSPYGPRYTLNGIPYKSSDQFKDRLEMIRDWCSDKQGEDYDAIRYLVDLRLQLQPFEADTKCLKQQATSYFISLAANQVAQRHHAVSSIDQSPCVLRYLLEYSFNTELTGILLSELFTKYLKNYAQFTFADPVHPFTHTPENVLTFAGHVYTLIEKVNPDAEESYEEDQIPEDKKQAIVSLAVERYARIYVLLEPCSEHDKFDQKLFLRYFTRYMRLCVCPIVRPFATAPDVFRFLCDIFVFGDSDTSLKYNLTELLQNDQSSSEFQESAKLWKELIGAYLSDHRLTPAGFWRVPVSLIANIDDFFADKVRKSRRR
jgi:hypothetical protein